MAAAYGGTKFGEWGERKHARRDWVLEDYMRRHPEDFEKRKYCNTFEMLFIFTSTFKRVKVEVSNLKANCGIDAQLHNSHSEDGSTPVRVAMR